MNIGLVSPASRFARSQWLRALAILAVLSTLLSVAVPRSASAATNLIVNGGFEAGNTSSWTVVSGDVDVVSGWQSSEGTYSLDLNGFFPGAISQSFPTVPGAVYKVLFDLAGNPGSPQGVKEVEVSAAADSAVYSFDTTGKSTASMGWTAKTFIFMATGASTTLVFKSLYSPDPFVHPDRAQGPALDNIRVIPSPTTLGRTPWQMFRPATYVSPVPNYGTHGNISYYSHAPAIPVENDPGWTAAPNGSTIGFGHGNFSRLTTCWTQVDFTFFQTFVDIPLGTTLTTFTIDFSGMDDGSRVTIFNSANPGGLVIPGSYVFLGGSGTTNLAPYIVDGETNRVVITQMDDCPVGNQLQSAVVNLNGTVIPPNSAPTIAANSASVSTNEGTIATNAGSYSDSNAGDNVGISASVGNVTKTGANSGTWSWSNPAPDGLMNYPVTITANDGNGGTTQTTFNVTVNNVAPTLDIGGANTVYYVDWTSANPGAGTATGVINLLDGSTIGLTFEAKLPNGSPSSYLGAQTGCGVNYWNPSAPYISPQVPIAPPNCELLQLSGGNSTIYKVTLSQPIVDPIMAIVSLGQPGLTVRYDFDSPFNIVSQGVGHFGGCATCLSQEPGHILRGNEGHGTIKFLGSYTTFSWTVPTNEFWHGFTFAVRSSQALAQTVIVNEGQTAANNGTFADVPADVVSITSSIGTVAKSGVSSGTWSWSFPTSDGPVQSQTVTLTATDEDGGVTVKTFPLVVNNVAPTITNAFQVAPIPEASVSVSGNLVVQATDPAGSNDPLVYEFDCDNNGSFETPAHPNTSAADCFFPDNGSFTVGVRVSDGDGGVATGTIIAVVTNVAPTATALGDVIDENGLAIVSGTLSDPSPADTFTLVIGWGAGEGSTTLTLPAGSTTFSATHQYLDDDPTGTPSDSYAISISATDDDGGVGNAGTTVVVNNVAPQVTGTGATINENGNATVSGTISDPGTKDTFTVVISWGAGEGSTTLTLPAGSTTFSASHQYLDDNPTGTASDTYNVSVTVTDDDGGVGTANAPVVVNNVDPAATASAAPTTQYWGLEVNFTGSATDVGTQDTHTFAWDFGDTTSASGASATHAYANPGSYTAVLTVTDDDTGSGQQNVNITVKKRETAIVYTGDSAATFGFGSLLSAKLSDSVVSGGPIAGRTITFTVNGVDYIGATAVSGQTNNVTLNPFPPLMPGTYTVTVNFAGDSHYLPSSATGTLVVSNSIDCKITGGGVRSSNNGRGGFNVQPDGAGVKGELQFQNNSVNFHAPTMTAIGCSPDRTKAWFAGTGRNGETFIVYVEDNGEPGRNDIFKIWINGVSQNGNGVITGGNIQIHKK